MFERSEIKQKIMETLMGWNYGLERASSYNIAKKIGYSQDGVYKVLRYLRDQRIASSIKGSWRLE